MARICHNSPGRTPTKKPGFLPNLQAATRLFLKKPGFWAPMRESYIM